MLSKRDEVRSIRRFIREFCRAQDGAIAVMLAVMMTAVVGIVS
jgi:hypothetical protein